MGENIIFLVPFYKNQKNKFFILNLFESYFYWNIFCLFVCFDLCLLPFNSFSTFFSNRDNIKIYGFNTYFNPINILYIYARLSYRIMDEAVNIIMAFVVIAVSSV